MLKSKQTLAIFTHKKELLGILLLSVFAFLFISFLSFSPSDRSWFYFASDVKEISNWGGQIGSNCASFFFFYFGSASYLVLMSLLFFSVILFFKKPVLFYIDRILSILILSVVTPTFLRAFRLDWTGSMSGGLVGNFFYKLFTSFLAHDGTLILLSGFLLVSLVLMFRISFIDMVVTFSGVVSNWLKFLSRKTALLLKQSVVWVSRNSWSFFKLAGTSLKSFILRLFQNRGAIKKFWGSRKSKGAEDVISNVDQDEIRKFQKESPDLVEKKGKDDEFWKSLHDMAQPKSELSFQDAFRDGSAISDDDSLSTASSALGRDLSLPAIALATVGPVSFDKFLQKTVRSKTSTIFLLGHQLTILPNSILKNNFLNEDFAMLISEASKTSVAEKVDDDLVKFNLPDLDLFEADDETRFDKEEVVKNAKLRGEKLEEKLERFGVKGKVSAIRPGPVITLFEYSPEIDTKISKIIALEDDLAMALKAMSIRIIAPIPGRNVVGFEISNQKRRTVYLSDVILKDEYKQFKGNIPLLLGVNIVGDPVIQDLVSMPHVLVAGSTGSGKSVGMNAMLIGMLCKFGPEKLKIVLIDPKRLEFAPYSDIPHLLFPIVTNPRQAAPVLKWLVQEMEERYEKMADAGVRNILEYQKVSKGRNLEHMPFIVLMIDELADLMMVAGKEVETQIARIAQMARAAGMHMIVATQRPSVDVVTGLIKVNFPSRVAFRVSSKIDSRTIVDSSGAEKLLGKGDMLYMNSSSSELSRIHGVFVSDKQVDGLASYLKAQQKVKYLNLNDELKRVTAVDADQFEDELYDDILEFIKTRDEVSISMLQRQYRIGFNRSARIIEKLELDGLLAPAQGSKARKVLREL